ncbi:MAG: poly-gamma-glutamate system protein [Betaproteobacteria bacterium]
MSGWGMKRGRVSLVFLSLAAVVAIGGFWAARKAPGAGASLGPYYDAQVEAAELMKRCAVAIRDYRLSLGILIDPELDPNETGLIGDEFTDITTTVGNLEAKRTATNPAFAALMVRYFKEAGLGPGDVVAIGASGSFPALILATLSAARALDLEPITVYSIGASMYGATVPELTFIDMLARLDEEGLIPYTLAAVSLGGDQDTGEGTLFGNGRRVMEEIARRAGVPVIREDTIVASIQRRLEVYRRQAADRPIRCFVNIGGATPNYGNTLTSLDFPNGLVMRPPVMSTAPDRGLIFEFAAAGIPVINLLDVRGLALKNGLPIDPVPLPPIGEGRIYETTKYSPGVALVTLVLSAAILWAGAVMDELEPRGRRT